MSDSDELVSSVVTQEKQLTQESKSDSESDFTLFKKKKRKGAEIKASPKQMSSDSEEDNDIKPVKKRRKIVNDDEACSKNHDTLQSLTAQEEKLGKGFSNAHKDNKNNVFKRQEELSSVEYYETEIIAKKEEENDAEQLRAKHMTESKKLQDEKCSSGDSVDYILCDGVKKESAAKQETRRQSGNISDGHQNSVQSSPSKKKFTLKEQVTRSESQGKNLNISQFALDSVNNEEKQQNTDIKKVIVGTAEASDSDSMEEESMSAVVKRSMKKRDSSTDSESENNKKKQQNTKTKVRSGREAASDSDSMEEEPLKAVVKKSVKKRDSSTDSESENNKKKQQNTKTKVRSGREAASDSDSMEEEPLTAVVKKTAKQSLSSPDSRKVRGARKQQTAKIEMKARAGRDSDSDEQKLLETVRNKIIKKRESSSDEENCKKKELMVKMTVKVGQQKDSDSDSDDEKPLNTVSEKIVSQRDGLNDANRGSSEQKPQNVMRKVSRRQGQVYDSDPEEADSTDDSVVEKLRKLVEGSESISDKSSKVSKSKLKSQKEVRTYSSDSDVDELMKMLTGKSEIKQTRKRDQGKEIHKQNSELDTEEEKYSQNSRQETHANSDSSDMTVDQSIRQRQSQNNQKKGRAQKTEMTLSDSAKEPGVSAGNRKRKRNVRNGSHGSDVDVASDTLMKVRAAKAVKVAEVKQFTESSTDSSDVEECKSEKISSETKTSYHTMSSSESEDISAKTKRRRTKTIKKVSGKNKAHKVSDSSADSSGSDDENSWKDKEEKGKKPAPENKRITSLKRYLRLAGIHIVTYTKVLQNCRSNKAKIERLLDILRKEGLKGKPSIQKCKHLRKKIETRREVQELDVGNIMEGKGRPQRSSRYTKSYNEDYKNSAEEKATCIQQRFSRIRDIIDSESD